MLISAGGPGWVRKPGVLVSTSYGSVWQQARLFGVGLSCGQTRFRE